MVVLSAWNGWQPVKVGPQFFCFWASPKIKISTKKSQVEVAKKLVMDRYQLEKRKFSVFENKNKDVNKEKHTKGKCQKFQVSTPVRAVARRFLKVY